MNNELECPNRPDWAMAGVPAIVGDGYCVHCSKIAGEWVACEAAAVSPPGEERTQE